MDRILVTGGGGFIGSNLVRRLVHDGFHVRILDNGFRGDLSWIKDYTDNIEFISGDVRNADDLERSAQGIDCIYHLAAINGTRFFYEMPETVLEVGVKGIIHLIDASIRHHVRRIILTSSSEVLHEPTIFPTPENHPLVIPDMTNPRFSYSGAKIISELMLLHYTKRGFFESIIIRPFNVYGPNMGNEHVIPELIRQINTLPSNLPGLLDLSIQGTGRETRTFCHIEDFIDGMIIAASSGKTGEIYNIGTDQEVSISMLAEKLAAIMRRKIRVVGSPLLAGSPVRRCPDIRKIRSLGFNPMISLEEGLRETVDWYLTH